MTQDFLIIGGGIAGAFAEYEPAAHDRALVSEAEDAAEYHATGWSMYLITRSRVGAMVRQVHAVSAVFFNAPPDGFTQTLLLPAPGCLTAAEDEDTKDSDTLLALSRPGEAVTKKNAPATCTMASFFRPDRVNCAVFEANVAGIDGTALHMSYLKGDQSRSAVVLLDQAVTALAQTGQIWIIQTAHSSFDVLNINNAAGSWAGQAGPMIGADPIGATLKRRKEISMKPPANTNCATLPAMGLPRSDDCLKLEGSMLIAPADKVSPVDLKDVWLDGMDIALLAHWIEQETTIKITKTAHSWTDLGCFVADKAPVRGYDTEVPKRFLARRPERAREHAGTGPYRSDGRFDHGGVPRRAIRKISKGFATAQVVAKIEQLA